MSTSQTDADVVLIGAGIMSATLGVMLRKLDPSLRIQVFERLDNAATESSDAWNNAGTGHSAFCELNYTPLRGDGSVDISKALKIASSFEESRQFWSYLVQRNVLPSPLTFINSIPHMSFVWGQENVSYLQKRHQALTKNALFEGMEFSQDLKQLKDWMPLIMEGRDPKQKLAATYMPLGTDVNFGTLTRALFNGLADEKDVDVFFDHEVKKLRQESDKHWVIKVKDLTTGEKRKVSSKFVFIGAGGGSLQLLEKSDIPEGKGYGGFPVGGQWLKCTNPTVVERHAAKVYGKAAVGSPPMSVPHLDTRVIAGKKALLFGPYAGFSTKFLKEGSYLDLFKSIKLDNIMPMIAAGMDNIPLTKYLVDQIRQSPEERLEALKEYVPTACREDWELAIAGQRVQVIKRDEKEIGVLEFGTEVITSHDGSIAALLGASPGASTAVSIMLDLINRCFKDKVDQWNPKLREMIPSYGVELWTDGEMVRRVRRDTSRVLGLKV
ncbi:MAG: malate:quinone oxidoreductase [Chryseolinea sp.]